MDICLGDHHSSHYPRLQRTGTTALLPGRQAVISRMIRQIHGEETGKEDLSRAEGLGVEKLRLSHAGIIPLWPLPSLLQRSAVSLKSEDPGSRTSTPTCHCGISGEQVLWVEMIPCYRLF